ncbi:MAG: BLUF domain-containing protein [Betaproteobacteria bacterium]|jgi:hypothetical protein
MIFQLTYVSKTLRSWSKAEIYDLAFRSSGANMKLGVSGILVYKDNSFMQVLEGKKNSVTALFKKIETDLRHQEVTLLNEVELEKADYRDWSMTFLNPDTKKFTNVASAFKYKL